MPKCLKKYADLIRLWALTENRLSLSTLWLKTTLQSSIYVMTRRNQKSNLQIRWILVEATGRLVCLSCLDYRDLNRLKILTASVIFHIQAREIKHGGVMQLWLWGMKMITESPILNARLPLKVPFLSVIHGARAGVTTVTDGCLMIMS